MRHPARIGAFFSGLALYSTAMLLVSAGTGVRLPALMVDTLGGPDSLELLLGEALLFALPLFLLALAWSYVTVRPRRRGRPPTTAWCLAGMALAWLGWLLYGAAHAAVDELAVQHSVAELLLSPATPPLWGLLNGLAVLLGVLIAGMLVRRQLPPLQR
jgi:hypothetical protein